MTIEKKSLISALKTTRKANAVKEDISGNVTTSTSQKMLGIKGPASKGPASKGPASKGPASKGPASKGPASKGLAAKW